jgi:hypothetical protein
MADLIVVVPSRGRPESVRELAEAFDTTCAGNTELVLAVDDNDPTWVAYSEAVLNLAGASKTRVSLCQVIEPASMVRALNATALVVASVCDSMPYAVGFMGDDHRPRSHGWDSAYLEALWDLGTGIVYGDDLLQGRKLPTQCAMTVDIVRTLGYMSPPSLTHMYVDNFWLALGEQAQCIKYLPDVVVEHRHPVAGKAQWDEGYKRVNDASMFAKDEAAFSEYCRTNLLGDVEKVRALRSAHV